MFLITIKVLFEMVYWVLLINITIHSIYYVVCKDYQTFIYDIVTDPAEPKFIDYFIIFSVFPGVLLKHCIKKILNFFKRCVTISQNRFRKIKVVIYYVPKHRRSNKG